MPIAVSVAARPVRRSVDSPADPDPVARASSEALRSVRSAMMTCPSGRASRLPMVFSCASVSALPRERSAA